MRTILTWYQTGGPYMIPLLAVAVAGLLILADRFAHLVLRTKINSRPFIERVISLVRAGKVDEALKLCADHQSALPDLGLVILRSRSENERGLLKVAEAATLTVVPGLTRRLAWLPVLATIAMLLGVLGGVANLHDALMQLAPTSAEARGAGGGPVLLAIAYALRPVGAGVLTAIPLVAGHAFLLHEAQNIVGQLEEFSARLVNALIDRPDVRLGHR